MWKVRLTIAALIAFTTVTLARAGPLPDTLVGHDNLKVGEKGMPPGPVAPGLMVCDTLEQYKTQLRYPNAKMEGCGTTTAPVIVGFEVIEHYSFAPGMYSVLAEITVFGYVREQTIKLFAEPQIQYGSLMSFQMEGEGA